MNYDMLKRLLYFSLIIPVVLSSCGGSGIDGTEIPDSIKNTPSGKMVEVSQEVIDDLVQNVSSPIEMAALIKKEGVPFSKDYLSEPDYSDDYNTNFKKAINLGIYGADLGYMNIYSKNGLIFNHITAIKKISEDLKIGQFFDFSTLKRLSSSSENLDSLMYISTSSFNKMDKYLRDNNRSNMSTLMVTGVWIEGLYLATQVAIKSKNPDIKKRIGLQKISLNDLLIVLKVYKSDKNFEDLIKDFEEIKAVFEPIKITVEKGEPTTKEVDGMLMIIQNDIQYVDIPEGQLEKIIKTISKVRNKIIGKKQ